MERQKMRKKGFTLVELLVVIAIIAMLLAVLMPALNKVRQLAQRLMCGTNIAGIGKSMLGYTNEDKYESYPVGGSPSARWAQGTGGAEGTNSFVWNNPRPFPENTTTPRVTLSAHLYLAVKYANASPDQFVCPGSDQKKFELSLYDMTGYTTSTILDVWDFGKRGTGAGGEKSPPGETRGKGHQSYSYQSPVRVENAPTDQRVYPLTTKANPRRPIMADRNPFWQLPIAVSGTSMTTARYYHWDATNKQVFAPSYPLGNSTSHQNEGQNVLYADLHTSFERSANCGIDMDNIYTVWGDVASDDVNIDKWKQCGAGAPDMPIVPGLSGRPAATHQASVSTNYYPRNENDTYLVSDLDG